MRANQSFARQLFLKFQVVATSAKTILHGANSPVALQAKRMDGLLSVGASQRASFVADSERAGL
jgi:hypothetical protein